MNTKTTIATLICIGSMVGSSSLIYGQVEAVAGVNYQQVATLKWYPAIQTGTNTFALGNTPEGVAFDGANIWVSNVNSSTVTKLRAADGAAVVNTCSTGAIRPFPRHSAYGSAKWALRGFTQIAAAELAASGIRVNAVFP